NHLYCFHVSLLHTFQDLLEGTVDRPLLGCLFLLAKNVLFVWVHGNVVQFIFLRTQQAVRSIPFIYFIVYPGSVSVQIWARFKETIDPFPGTCWIKRR